MPIFNMVEFAFIMQAMYLPVGTTVVKLNLENDSQSKKPSKPVQLYFTEKRNI